MQSLFPSSPTALPAASCHSSSSRHSSSSPYSSPSISPPASDAVHDDDSSTVQSQLSSLEHSLSPLPLSQQRELLLSALRSSYQQQLQLQREAERCQRVSEKQRQLTARLSSRCGGLQQRLTVLLDEGAGLRDELRLLQAEADAGWDEGVNGKQEKQQNGRPHAPQPGGKQAAAASSQPDHFLAFNDLSDFSSLLASTEAKLAVERRQREQQSGQSAFSPSAAAALPPASSVYYHHDHTLTAEGKAVVRSILMLFSPSAAGHSAPPSLSFSQLQQLVRRVGRGDAEGGGGGAGDDGGELWWLWQSGASETDSGEMRMNEEELQAVYEQDWDLESDARKLRIA